MTLPMPLFRHPYARSRILAQSLAAMVVTALMAAGAAAWLLSRSGFDQTARVPVVVLGPLLAACVLGTALYAHSDELERTAARRAWPSRAVHVVGLTAVACGLLAAAVPGHQETFGAPAMVRNMLGAAGIAAGGAAVVGARLSWLPVIAYLSSVYLAAPRIPGNAASVWAWSMQPGPQPWAWGAAAGAFGCGSVLYTVRGAYAGPP